MTRSFDIILAEDSEYDAELTRRALSITARHHSILHLKDGAEVVEHFFGLASLKSKKFVPKLLLIDLKMPKMTGIEVLQKIKSNEITRSIPVVILTSSKEECDIQTCYKLGANSYVVKPMEFDEYTRTVSNVSSYWLKYNQPPLE